VDAHSGAGGRTFDRFERGGGDTGRVEGDRGIGHHGRAGGEAGEDGCAGSGEAGDHLQVRGAASHLVPESAHVLGFDLRDRGFHVVLDRRLPKLIEGELAAVVEGFVRRLDMEPPRFYAVHAGGPRVFDAVESALGLRGGELEPSRRAFREVGNLSSASILFTLAGLDGVSGDGLGLAFGPGVTIELTHLHR